MSRGLLCFVAWWREESGAKNIEILLRCEQASGRGRGINLKEGREVDITHLEGRKN
jgi:hypothetical protein